MSDKENVKEETKGSKTAKRAAKSDVDKKESEPPPHETERKQLLQAIEMMNALRKGQARWVSKTFIGW